uniref:Queuine tRNA-ribosyltransferase accessory subunit 2 n=1 Tax=Dicentrarchus labrax TaxID=13489 RepID=E6ZIT7_DICLA|nr:Queuine tRNA-ribosyltransferase subunit qtrtd1 [Dicentrarchus labrax]
MKLELSRVVQGRSRLGVLKRLGRAGQHSLEVPGCLLYTHLGTVPHLTQDTLHTLSNLPSVTQVTLSNIAEHQEVLEEFKDGFRKFSGLHDTVLYCSLHDPATPCPTGYTTNKELEGVEVFGAVEGGDILEERVRSARETAKRPVAGFCLDGLQTGSMDQALRTQLITAVTKELPEDKPRLLQGVGRPDEVLECVDAGVDLFESFFPFQVTERGCALCFSFDVSPDPERAVLELDGEKEMAGETQQNGDLNLDDQTQMTSFEINLKDKRYQGDFRPLVEGCGCYCCKNHQRAYLHHLLVTNELLAGVLLMIHNTAHYHGFFSALREALANDKLDLLKRRVLRERDGQT